MTKGWGPWKQEWYSICSHHRETADGCDICLHGTWVNVWKHNVGSVVYAVAPGLWRWWANR